MDNNWNPEGNTDNLKSQQGGPYNGQPYQPQQGQQGWTPQQQPYNPYAQQQPQFNPNPPQQQPYLNPNPQQYQPYQQPVQQTQKTVPPKKSKLPIIITIIAVLVIGLGVGAYFLFFRGGKNGEDTQEGVVKALFQAINDKDKDKFTLCFTKDLKPGDESTISSLFNTLTGANVVFDISTVQGKWEIKTDMQEDIGGYAGTVEFDQTVQGNTYRVKEEFDFEIKKESGKWVITKCELKEDSAQIVGGNIPENLQKPSETDIQNATTIGTAAMAAMAYEDVFDEAYGKVYDKGYMILTATAGDAFGASSANRQSEKFQSEVNKSIGGKTNHFSMDTWQGEKPELWGIFVTKDYRIEVYGLKQQYGLFWEGWKLYPETGTSWEIISEDTLSTEPYTIEEPTEEQTEEKTETSEENTATASTEDATEAVTGSAPAGEWVNFSDMHFYVNGKKYTFGKSTLQDLIDDGVPFDENDMEKFDNDIPKNSESYSFRITLGEYWSASIMVLNNTEQEKKAKDCVISSLFYNTKKDQTQNVISFDWPLTLSQEELLATLGEPDDKFHYPDETAEDQSYVSDKYTWQQESEQYIGYKKYVFEYVNGNLDSINIFWK